MHYTLSVSSLLFLLVSACGTDPDPPTCAEGQLLDGEQCVSEACGTGTWGNLETDGDTIYVDGTAQSGGDGSMDRPFAGIQEGLDAQGKDGMVAVAAGTYVENLQVSSDHSGAHLAGRCRELVTIDGREGSEENWAEGCGIYLEQTAMAGHWTVSGLTLTGASWLGVLQVGGTLELDRVASVDNRVRGITVEYGTLTATDCLVSGNHAAGVVASGAEATLDGLEILDTQPHSDGEGGYGIVSIDGSTVVASDCTVQGNHGYGVMVSYESSLTLQDGQVLDTLQEEDGRYGHGIEVAEDSTLTAIDC
ncbi:MAG: right-handed parallel beta-helix repeat-containing protein, partial [Myxococcota bacterium]|nr:right-handed parallel beta-helix repeat-containing protein [Myxococcota bacterium]